MRPRPTFGPEGRDFPRFEDFETEEEFWFALDDLNRWNNGLGPPPKPPPEGLRPIHAGDRRGSRQVGLRLPDGDYQRLVAMADDHALAPSVLARMLVVRALRTRRANSLLLAWS